VRRAKDLEITWPTAKRGKVETTQPIKEDSGQEIYLWQKVMPKVPQVIPQAGYPLEEQCNL